MEDLVNQLCQAVLQDDKNAVVALLSEGCNPNEDAAHGMSPLGEAARKGNIEILQLLLVASQETESVNSLLPHNNQMKRRKLNLICDCDETDKCSSGAIKETSKRSYKNQGYYVFNYHESTNLGNRSPNLTSPSSPSLSLEELEWDEELGNVAPITCEDETCTALYEWYAKILENSGSVLESAAVLNKKSQADYGVNHEDAFGRIALFYAASQGHNEAVKLLLDAGSKLNTICSDGLTPLLVAVMNNQIKVAKTLLKAGAQVNFKTYDKMAPLHVAAAKGYFDIVKILVKNGACVNARDMHERTALHLAVINDHTDIVVHLVSNGANIHIEDMYGSTPLKEAVWNKNVKVVELLLSCGARITQQHYLLHTAIAQRQDDVMLKALVQAGASVNVYDCDGFTPLMHAVMVSQLSVVRLLLQNGALVNACNNITGATALHVAVEHVLCPKRFEELLNYFLDYGFDINHTTFITGDTALNRALLLHNDSAVKTLIRYGADVNTSFHYAKNNLSWAISIKAYSVAYMLIKAGHRPIVHLHDPPIPSREENFLRQLIRQPMTLQDFCRLKIRSLSNDRLLFRYITTLPLPQKLKRFLKMETEDYDCT